MGKAAKRLDAVQMGENAGLQDEDMVITSLVLWLFSHPGGDFMASLFSYWFNSFRIMSGSSEHYRPQPFQWASRRDLKQDQGTPIFPFCIPFS